MESFLCRHKKLSSVVIEQQQPGTQSKSFTHMFTHDRAGVVGQDGFGALNSSPPVGSSLQYSLINWYSHCTKVWKKTYFMLVSTLSSHSAGITLQKSHQNHYSYVNTTGPIWYGFRAGANQLSDIVWILPKAHLGCIRLGNQDSDFETRMNFKMQKTFEEIHPQVGFQYY